MGVYKDLTGFKTGRLTVLSRAEDYISPSGRAYIMWNCVCDCGSNTIVRTSGLTSKSSKSNSCGCFSSETTKKRATTHNMSKSRTYTSYRAMIKRCGNINDPSYNNYGGRGIKVCKRWLESFDNFLEDMGVRPNGCSIDRVDNNLGYNPHNCKWSTKSEQQLNRRKVGKTSKYRGVHFCNLYKKFISQVRFKEGGIFKNKKIGSFNNEYDAALAFDKFIKYKGLPNKTNNLI